MPPNHRKELKTAHEGRVGREGHAEETKHVPSLGRGERITLVQPVRKTEKHVWKLKGEQDCGLWVRVGTDCVRGRE